MIAVVCSSWSVVNLGTSKRDILTPLGDETCTGVRVGNKMTSRTQELNLLHLMFEHLVEQKSRASSCEDCFGAGPAHHAGRQLGGGESPYPIASYAEVGHPNGASVGAEGISVDSCCPAALGLQNSFLHAALCINDDEADHANYQQSSVLGIGFGQAWEGQAEGVLHNHH